MPRPSACRRKARPSSSPAVPACWKKRPGASGPPPRASCSPSPPMSPTTPVLAASTSPTLPAAYQAGVHARLHLTRRWHRQHRLPVQRSRRQNSGLHSVYRPDQERPAAAIRLPHPERARPQHRRLLQPAWPSSAECPWATSANPKKQAMSSSSRPPGVPTIPTA